GMCGCAFSLWTGEDVHAAGSVALGQPGQGPKDPPYDVRLVAAGCSPPGPRFVEHDEVCLPPEEPRGGHSCSRSGFRKQIKRRVSSNPRALWAVTLRSFP